ncbi:rhomboid family intramembrane serine protease [Deinococcus sp.]|uniref:rhomboid family intramembrane serine protease n=1 Tax=Deinococcus sp. TaxID=47478 RepID=UPI003B5C397C
MPDPLQPALRSPTALDSASSRVQWGSAAGLTALLIGVLWLQEFVDQLVFGGRLDAFGIVPRHLEKLGHIFTAPFLHGDFTHLIGNTVPLAVLAFLSALRGAARFLMTTLIIVVIGGFLVWLLARGALHLGASELVFGYFGYLLASAWYERRPSSVITALIALALYGGTLWGVLPSDPRISWESHLFGFVAGLLAARWLTQQKVLGQQKD